MARAYERQPQKIANRVYANRMGNGDEASGEGWKYRGRGPLQLTGKNNYRAFGKYIGREQEVLDNPDIVANELGFESALWFFDANKLWSICDQGINDAAILQLTKRINGGTHGLDDRKAKTKKYAAWL
jgi:putative chitinase